MATDWTVDTLKEYVEAMFAEREKAVTTALVASEKRFDSVNEFRETLADQQRTFATMSEVNLMRDNMREKVDRLQHTVDTLVAERAGIKGGWALAGGVVALVLGLIAAFWK